MIRAPSGQRRVALASRRLELQPAAKRLLEVITGELLVFPELVVRPLLEPVRVALVEIRAEPLRREVVRRIANQDVIEQCRILIWAMITTWRWRRDDQLPNGRYWATEGLNRLRSALDADAAGWI